MQKVFHRGLLLGGAAAALQAQAVIISGGDGSGNTSAPPDDPGWANVGRILMDGHGPSSITYLGNDWFITAAHVWQLDNPTGVFINANSYAVDAASWVRLTNSSGPSAGTAADLALFRVTTTVSNLPTLTVSGLSLANGSAVTMIGDGYDRQSTQTWWDSSWNVTDSASGVYSGFVWAASAGTKRWGQNNTDESGSIDDGYGVTSYFRTTFAAGGTANEAQGALYDSGGGVFFKNGADWELAGIMLTIDEAPGQPLASAVFGNTTYMADLATYRDQIVSLTAIPEPAGVVIVGAAALFAVRRWRRWRT